MTKAIKQYNITNDDIKYDIYTMLSNPIEQVILSESKDNINEYNKYLKDAQEYESKLAELQRMSKSISNSIYNTNKKIIANYTKFKKDNNKENVDNELDAKDEQLADLLNKQKTMSSKQFYSLFKD